jgi:hypothetical protein
VDGIVTRALRLISDQRIVSASGRNRVNSEGRTNHVKQAILATDAGIHMIHEDVYRHSLLLRQ